MSHYVTLPLGEDPPASQFESLSLGGEPSAPAYFEPRPPSHRPPQSLAQSVDSPRIIINVSDPMKQGSGLQAFTSYKISCFRVEQNQKATSPMSTANRRYTNFVWLHTQLLEHFPCYFIPILPEKTSITPFFANRFEDTFVEGRRMALEQYLNRIARHPELISSPLLKTFLEGSEEEMRMPEAKKPSFFTGLLKEAGLSSNTKAGSFAPPDSEFDSIKTYIKDVETNLSELHKFLERMIRRRKELGTSMSEFGMHLMTMGNDERKETSDEDSNATSKSLLDLGSCCDHLSKSIKEQSNDEAKRALMLLDDWLRLIQGVKEALRTRYAAAETHLSLQAELERKTALHNKAAHQGGKISVSEADLEEGRRRVEEARVRLDTLSDRIRSEIKRFRKDKALEIRTMLCVLVTVQLKYGAEVQDSWERVLPSLVQGIDPLALQLP